MLLIILYFIISTTCSGVTCYEGKWTSVPFNVAFLTAESTVIENYVVTSRIQCSYLALLKKFPSFCYVGEDCTLFDFSGQVSADNVGGTECYFDFRSGYSNVCAGQADGAYFGSNCNSVVMCKQGISYTPKQSSVCEPPFLYVANIGCIYRPPQGNTWCEGRYLCLSMGADLWSIPAWFENLRLYAVSNVFEPTTWIGIKRTSGIPQPDDWVWISGEHITGASPVWGGNEPHNNNEVVAGMVPGYAYLLADFSLTVNSGFRPMCLRK